MQLDALFDTFNILHPETKPRRVDADRIFKRTKRVFKKLNVENYEKIIKEVKLKLQDISEVSDDYKILVLKSYMIYVEGIEPEKLDKNTLVSVFQSIPEVALISYRYTVLVSAVFNRNYQLELLSDPIYPIQFFEKVNGLKFDEKLFQSKIEKVYEKLIKKLASLESIFNQMENILEN